MFKYYNQYKKFFSAAAIFLIIAGFLGYLALSNIKEKITENENKDLSQPKSMEMPEEAAEPLDNHEISFPKLEGGEILLEKPLEGKSILMVVSFDGFKDKEYFTPKQYFLSAGAENVLTASNQMGDAVGADGGKVPVNLLLKDVKVSDFDAVVFVGGPGTSKYLYNEDVYRIASTALSQGKILGAIAEAQVIFKNATGKIVFANTDQDSDIFAINIIDFLSQ